MRRILILNTFPSGGGAAMMAAQTLEGLRALGCDARMLVAGPLTPDAPDFIQSIGGIKWTFLRCLEKGETLIALRGNRKNLFRFSTASTGLSDILSHPWLEWCDTLSIHWVQQSFLSLSQLGRLLSLSGKKIIWTLHDLWPITGGCHSPYSVNADGSTRLCDRFVYGCGDCPILSKKGDHPGGQSESETKANEALTRIPELRGLRSSELTSFALTSNVHPKLQTPNSELQTPNSKLKTKKDLSSRLFDEKMRWPLEGVTFQAVSRLTERYLKQSPIGSKGKTVFLPNCYDPSVFFVKERHPKQKQILFAATRPDDPVKGLDLAKEALRKAVALNPDISGCTFTIVGKPKSDALLRDFPIPLKVFPEVSRTALADLYRSSALTLSSSRSETFGLTLLESIACGTPVVSFALPGPATFVRHGKNGLLAPPFDTAALAETLLSLLSSSDFIPSVVSDTVAEYRREAVLRQFLLL